MIESNKLAVCDLDTFPEDDNRYELIDGELFIDGEEPTREQWMLLGLYTQLSAVCPPHMELIVTPWEIQHYLDAMVRPDMLMVPYRSFADPTPTGPALLAVEITPPSGERTDLDTRKETYEQLGVRSCWVVDPIEPNLTAFELDDSNKYRIVMKVDGNEPFEASSPFRARISLTKPLGSDKPWTAGIIGANPEVGAP